jgi:hypothetical protein
LSVGTLDVLREDKQASNWHAQQRLAFEVFSYSAVLLPIPGGAWWMAFIWRNSMEERTLEEEFDMEWGSTPVEDVQFRKAERLGYTMLDFIVYRDDSHLESQNDLILAAIRLTRDTPAEVITEGLSSLHPDELQAIARIALQARRELLRRQASGNSNCGNTKE